MPATRQDWARAYALQALSDLRAREVLVAANVEKCHRLHFLQMAAERRVKLILPGKVDIKVCAERMLSLGGTRSADPCASFLCRYERQHPDSGLKLEQMKRLAHEIEVIAPACNAGEVREDNSEYPWLDAHDEVQIPCRHFPKIDDGSREIIEVIRLIRAAAEKYAQ